MGVTYDTGALLAGERNDRDMWLLHGAFLDLGVTPTVPVTVLAQAWRGGPRQAALSRLLQQCRIEPMSEDQAREVGLLLGLSDTADVVDATVVATALRNQDTSILTSDPKDLRAIADLLGFDVNIEVI